MNAKQFVSSFIFRGVDWGVSKIPVAGPALALPFRVAFPTMGYERVNSTAMRPGVFFSVYLIGFITCFVLQAYLAHRAGNLGDFDLSFGATLDPRGGPAGSLDRIMFLDDAYNLFNYTILVPLYLVAGTGYMISVFSLKERMAGAGSGHGFQLDDSVKPLFSGLVAVGAFVLLLVTLQAGYAVDIQQKSLHLFWFHGNTKTSSFNYNGYAYLVINNFLAGFVILIALLHLELFRWSSILARGIRSYSAENDTAQIFVDDGNKLKELFSPFTETAIWSKAFAMLLAINIYTWKASGVSGGQSVADVANGVADNSWFFRFVFVLFIAIALWIVSLPRYRIQYELFKLRSRHGVHEYFDIRMPWTIGWSVFIDILLFFFFSTAIFGTGDIFALIESLFHD